MNHIHLVDVGVHLPLPAVVKISTADSIGNLGSNYTSLANASQRYVVDIELREGHGCRLGW